MEQPKAGTKPMTVEGQPAAVGPGEAARYEAIKTAITVICQTLPSRSLSIAESQALRAELSRLVTILAAQPDSAASESERSGRPNSPAQPPDRVG